MSQVTQGIHHVTAIAGAWMNIVYGLYTQDEGEIEIRGTPVQINEPNDAIALGIGMVHQHFQLVPVFTVAENIVMGNEPTRFSFSWRTMLTVASSPKVISTSPSMATCAACAPLSTS